MHRFSVISIFPELIAAFCRAGIVRKVCEAGLAAIDVVNPRDFSDDARGTIDDAPYGGGPGMVMLFRPLRRSIEAAKRAHPHGSHVIYLSPQGQRLTQEALKRLARHEHLILLAGRYEGIDERLIGADVDSEWSLGDYVLSGGEIPAMALIDGIVRLLPGALGDARSALQDSFSCGLLDHPHYTRPETIADMAVPPVLLSGNHAAIETWRRKAALGRTWCRRPDLLDSASLSPEDRALLAEFIAERGEGSAGRA